MATAKTWHLLPHDPFAIQRLAQALRVSPIVGQLLVNRGLTEPEAARRFLETPLNGLHQPELLPGVGEAAGRLLAAARAGRHICVYGDYDVDGLTGTALLVQALRLVGAEHVDFYVPHRLEEGYGLKSDALRNIAARGGSVVVTVDCGIASVAEAEEARRLGLELIITDHHEPREQLPDAAVRVHPRLPDGSYPFDKLSGSAVAFKVAWALCLRASGGGDRVTPRFREYLLDSVCLAALGIVADVVPLQDENRILVRHGLARLRKSPLLGLKTLLESAGFGEGAELRASDVGYRLAPRLNAAGRLGSAHMVVDLLTTASPERAATLVRSLEQQNEQRQILERGTTTAARALAEQYDLARAPALVLASADWHGGIIGIVAGRLAEQFGRPTLMIALRKERGDSTAPDLADAPLIGVGSGRSVPGFPLHEALRGCGDLLLSHGGHKTAAGFKIKPENIEAFRERFCAIAARHFPEGPPPARLVIDAEVPLCALTHDLLRELDKLEPYGSANSRPLFLAGGLEVLQSPRRIGGGERHLSFRVRQQGTTMRAVAWGMGERLEELMSGGGWCSLVFTPKINEWNGYRSVEMEVVDFQAGRQARLE
jgi:single-stranded-DNA-specific exonuclease